MSRSGENPSSSITGSASGGGPEMSTPEPSFGVRQLRAMIPEVVESTVFGEVPIRLVEPRVLRRMIHGTMRRVPLLGRVPHRKGLLVDQMLLVAEATPREVGYTQQRWMDLWSVPRKMILLTEPGFEHRHEEPRLLLMRYWRLLFHARLHLRYSNRSGHDPYFFTRSIWSRFFGFRKPTG